MPEITVELMQSLVDSGQGGNTAGIVFPADHLSTSEKQFIAASVGISEIAFIGKSAVAAYKLDFFTPNKQIPHCGHATIAAFCYLYQHKQVFDGWSSKETIDGNRKILIDHGQAYMQQNKPVYRSIEESGISTEEIIASIGLNKEQLHPQLEIKVVNTGNAFLVIPLTDIHSLQTLQPNRNEIYWLSDKLDVVGFYPFSPLPNNSIRHASTRMFAPRYGIAEESATGTAAGPLAGYLFDFAGYKQTTFYIEQGHWMKHPSPSLIQVDLTLEQDSISEMMVGGSAVTAGKKHLTW